MGTDRSTLTDFCLPSLGADMEEGTILQWRVGPGDTVRRGDIVALIDTEKSEIDLEIWQSGVIEELVVGEGELVAVGTVLARLRTDGAGRPSAPASPPAPPAEPPAKAVTPPATGPHAAPLVLSPLVRRIAEKRHVDLATVVGSGPGGRIQRRDIDDVTTPHPGSGVLSSPRARALARDLGLDLSALVGSGPGGAILAADVVRAGAGPRPPDVPTGDATVPPRQGSPRRAIAEIMSRSNREIPHYYLASELDCTRVMADLTTANENRPVRDRLLAVVPLLVAAAQALRKHPELNGFWRDDQFEPGGGIHLGVAVTKRGGGLVAPAILDADALGPDEMMRALADLVARARAGRLRGSEMASPTITVTSLGDRGPSLVLPVIYPPQVAMIGFGSVAPRPWVVEDRIEVRTMVTASLAGDHRATDGDRGARFLGTLATLLDEMEIP